MKHSSPTLDHEQLGRWARAAQAGEQDAAGHLYTWLQPRLYAVALSVLGHGEDARDAVQDAFLIAFMRLHELRDPTMVAGWMRRIVQHLCYRRSARPHPLHLLPEVQDGTGLDAMSAIMREEDDIALLAALDTLPEKLRLTLVLRFFSRDNDYDTLAERLDVPVGTVRSRLNDAKARMRNAWTQAIEAGGSIPAETTSWNGFYMESFAHMHTDEQLRDRLLEHIVPNVHMVFTSGKEDRGRGYLEREINDDLVYGSWTSPLRVLTSGALSIVEVDNLNSKEFPDRCPPSSTLVMVRERDRAVRIHFYNSARPLGVQVIA